jgi:IPT/TIG domain
VRDRLIHVVEGKYAGHPNRNRGRSDARQCEWRDPFDLRTDFYEPPLATFESSTDGLLEYTSNLLGGQLKGNVLASKYESSGTGRIYRVRLNTEGGVRVAGIDSLWEASGLAISMSPWGDILSTRVYTPVIMSLRPQYKVLAIPMFASVLPFRGQLGGGNLVQVSGHNFGANPVAVFGEKPCTGVTDVASDGTSFRCIVPPGDVKGASVQVSVRVPGQATAESAGGVDYLYMAV